MPPTESSENPYEFQYNFELSYDGNNPNLPLLRRNSRNQPPMASKLLFAGATAAVILALYYGPIYQAFVGAPLDDVVDQSVCGVNFLQSNISGECFFRQDYRSARELFLKSAAAAGAELVFLPVTAGLGTDVAIIKGSDHLSGFLIHLSGIHGVEGYAGSAIQSAALQYIGHMKERKYQKGSEENDKEAYNDAYPTLVFIHAVNPFGFENNRRVNEDNIDLNRNFLTEEEFTAVKTRDPNYSGYVDLNNLINPTVQASNNGIINDIVNIFRTLLALSRYGLLHLKKALVSGNYHKQNGVGFGGFTMSKSVHNLIELVHSDKLDITMSDRVVLVDVHTGLGPEGVDTVFTNPPGDLIAFPTEEDFGLIRSGSTKPVITGGIHANVPNKKMKESDALSGYDLTVGQTTSGFCDNFLSKVSSKTLRTCLLQEIGTVSPIVVGRNMIAENYAHFYGSAAEKVVYTERYKNCFYVQRNAWKRNVVRRGLKVILQSLDLLGTPLDMRQEPVFTI